MKKVFITSKIPSVAKELLSKHFTVEEYLQGQNISKEELVEVVKTYDGILSMYCDSLDEEVLSYADKLKVISNYAIGLNNIDCAFAKQKNIAVYNLPDIVTASTADLTFAILLSLIRKICPAKKFVLDGKWERFDPNLFEGEELSGKTLGIIGFGRTGQAVAQRAKGFGLNVIFYNRSKKKHQDARQVSFDTVLQKSDYLSLHVPLTEKTYHLISLASFEKMEQKPILINVARGSVVKTEDLVLALKKGLIRGAALDVTDPEPIGKNHPLFFFEQCLIVPHIGTATKECRYQMAKKAAEQIISYFSRL